MEVIVVALVELIVTIILCLAILSVDEYYEARCESLEFRVETLEEENEKLIEFIERNEEKWKD